MQSSLSDLDPAGQVLDCCQESFASAATTPSQATHKAIPLLQSDALLQGCKCVHIAHNGARYQLQATRQGKLILTK